MTKRIISWDEYLEAVDHLARKLEQLYDPREAAIIGISRGGLIPATILAHRLGVPGVLVGYTSHGRFVLPGCFPMCKQWLIVDDLYDTGHTTAAVLRGCQEEELCGYWKVLTFAYVFSKKGWPYHHFRREHSDLAESQVALFHTGSSEKEDTRWYVFPYETEESTKSKVYRDVEEGKQC